MSADPREPTVDLLIRAPKPRSPPLDGNWIQRCVGMELPS